jgi:TolB-like protein
MIADDAVIEIDPQSDEVRSDDRCCRTSPRVVRLLHLFADSDGQLVTKDEAMAALWDGRAVSDNALATVLKETRRILGDDGARQQVIRTVHGLGFRCLRPVRVLGRAGARLDTAALPEASRSQGLQQYGQPSLAVLPFTVHVGEADGLDYLGEAIPAELIAGLSRLRWIALTARASTFRFRGTSPDLEAISKALGVRYCLTGSLEASGGKLAVLAELARTADGRVIWSERLDAPIDGVHELRERIARLVVGAMEVHVPACEAEAARLLAPEDLDAWAEFHLGLRHLYRFNANDNAIARHHFLRAIAKDPGFARAHAGLSFSSFQSAFMAYAADRRAELAKATSQAERSLELDPFDPFGAYCMGRSNWASGDPGAARIWMARSVEICPSFAQGHYAHALMGALTGEAAPVLKENEYAMALSPLDPLRYAMLGTQCHAAINQADFRAASYWADRAARWPGSHYLLGMLASAACQLNGDAFHARYWRRSVRDRRPDADVFRFFEAFPYTDIPERRLIEGALRAAGFKG